MTCDPSSSDNIYRKVGRILRRNIKGVQGLLAPDAALVDQFEVNQHSLRQAVEALIDEGLLQRSQGKGTPVLEPVLDDHIGPHREGGASWNNTSHITDVHLLKKQQTISSAEVSEALSIGLGAAVIQLETLRLVEEKPFCVTSHYFPARGMERMVSYVGGSVHQYIHEQLEINPICSKSRISSKLPTEGDHILLKMPKDLPVLYVKSVKHGGAFGRPVEYAVTRFRSDRVQLVPRHNPTFPID